MRFSIILLHFVRLMVVAIDKNGLTHWNHLPMNKNVGHPKIPSFDVVLVIDVRSSHPNQRHVMVHFDVWTSAANSSVVQARFYLIESSNCFYFLFTVDDLLRVTWFELNIFDIIYVFLTVFNAFMLSWKSRNYLLQIHMIPRNITCN